jgi:hypothetical protein
MSRSIRPLVATILAIGILTVAATSVFAAKPVSEHQGKMSDTFFDDFILDLCGIETMTTVTESWTLTTYADGTQRFRASRKFVPADHRIPIEYGAGMSFWDANGVQTVHGSPIRLQSQDGGGITLLDAGLVTFGDDLTVHGPHPSLGVDLADYYCP